MNYVKTKLLITIANKDSVNLYLKLYKKIGVISSFASRGMGTASSSLLSYFGLDQIKKEIIFSTIREDMEGYVLKELYEKAKINNPDQGIAFTISIMSTSAYILEQYSDYRIKEKIKMKNKKEYELVFSIVSEGYSDIAMDAAKKAGANGGTLIKGRSLSSEEVSNFLGLSVQKEKEIVLVIVTKEHKHKVMEEITKATGLTSKAQGICFSIPVDAIVGLGEKINFTKE